MKNVRKAFGAIIRALPPGALVPLTDEVNLVAAALSEEGKPRYALTAEGRRTLESDLAEDR